MKKIIMFLSIALVLGFKSVSFAACSEEELKSKITTLMSGIQEVCKQDPDKCQKISVEMQTKLSEVQKDPNLDKLCKFYDDFIAELKK